MIPTVIINYFTLTPNLRDDIFFSQHCCLLRSAKGSFSHEPSVRKIGFVLTPAVYSSPRPHPGAEIWSCYLYETPLRGRFFGRGTAKWGWTIADFRHGPSIVVSVENRIRFNTE